MAARAALSPGPGRRRLQARALRRRRPQPRPFVRLGGGGGALTVRSPPASPGLAVSRVPLLCPLAPRRCRLAFPPPHPSAPLLPQPAPAWRRRLLLSGAPGPTRSPPLGTAASATRRDLGPRAARAAAGWAEAARTGPPVAADQRPPGTGGPSLAGRRGGSAGGRLSRRPPARSGMNSRAGRRGGETPEPTPPGGRAAHAARTSTRSWDKGGSPLAGEQPRWACAAAGEGPGERREPKMWAPPIPGLDTVTMRAGARPRLAAVGGRGQHRDHKESREQRVFQQRKKLNSQ